MLKAELGSLPELGPESERLAAEADGNSCPGTWPESAGLAQRPAATQIWFSWDELFLPATDQG